MRSKKRISSFGAGTMVLTCFMQVSSWGAYLILNDGSRKTVDSMKVRPNGDAAVVVGGQQQLFTRSNYRVAMGDKPAEYDRAGALAQQGKHDEAIALLDKIIKDLYGQYWDLKAISAKASVLLKKGDAEKAARLLEETFVRTPQFAAGDALGNYFQALIDTKNYEKLDGLLSKTISKGKPDDAARAHVTRGDMLMAKDDAANAVLDYLITATLMGKDKTLKAEASYKAGIALEKLKNARAKEQFKLASESAPDSEWGKKAKGKL